MEIIRPDQISAEMLEGVDTVWVTDGVVRTLIWKHGIPSSGRSIWIALRRLTPEEIDPVIDRLVGLGLGPGVIQERWWDAE